ncbi:MAG: Fic family protein [Kiritimatiellae bacterium]|jgi:Fic family protein|nr:Fic family protein [Kiritimatiellia bacterium]
MKKNETRLGTYVLCKIPGENYQAFIPPTLPPEPAIDLIPLQELLSKANQAIGRLDGASEVLPDSSILLYYYVRKEAVLSSQIEGTQSSLSDLLLYESNEVPSVPIDDVVEVSSYVAALEYGLKRVKEGFPLSLRLIREMHEILLSKGRGSNKQPGRFRTSQNWIGGTRPGNAVFVPPPANRLMECLSELEKYFHLEERTYTSLIDAGLIHVQFETIHPFLDGNGRIGRLLITFFLIMMGDIREPNLYLSLFFKNNRNAYYEKLGGVRTAGDWEGWLKFFLTGVIETANQVAQTSQAISNLFEENKQKIDSLKKARTSAHKVHEILQQKAILNANNVAKIVGVSTPTARAALNNLKALGIVKDINGSGKQRIYIYKKLIDLLETGTTPINY